MLSIGSGGLEFVQLLPHEERVNKTVDSCVGLW